MYIVREKKTGQLLYADMNVDKALQPREIKEKFPDFNAKTMETGWSVHDTLPDHFIISKEGKISEMSLQDQMKKGLLSLASYQKISGNQIVEKSLAEKVTDGLLKLEPQQKIIKNEIVEKTLNEQVEEGLIVLGSHEKIENNQVVGKTLEERVRDGLEHLNQPFTYAKGDEVLRRTVKQLIEGKFLKTRAHCREALDKLGVEMEQEIATKYSVGREMKILKSYLYWMDDGKPDKDKREKQFKEMKAYTDKVKKEFMPLKDEIKKLLETLNK